MDYIGKVMAYESGEGAPTGEGGLSSVFVADQSTRNENFEKNSLALGKSLRSAQPQYETRHIDLSQFATNSKAKEVLISEFNSDPLLMTYLGHGAEDQWASTDAIYA